MANKVNKINNLKYYTRLKNYFYKIITSLKIPNLVPIIMTFKILPELNDILCFCENHKWNVILNN